MKKVLRGLFNFLICLALTYFAATFVLKYFHEQAVLKKMISRLEADTRIAEVLVSGVNFDEVTQKTFTTIKFLEYDVDGQPLEPKYFTFSGNIIQFQSLVIRFEDFYVKNADKLRGKSAYLFWKVFMLDGTNTAEYEINHVNAVPDGYRLKGKIDPFEEKLWHEFWQLALDPQKAKKSGVKNAQIEAPGTLFIPGVLYTIRIEHDGGMRIDTTQLSPILRGELIPK